MIRMTKQLQAALERLDREGGDSMAFAGHAASILAALRAAGTVEGRWEALQDEERQKDVWWVMKRTLPDGSGYNEVRISVNQRTAEAYAQALNAADADLEAR